MHASDTAAAQLTPRAILLSMVLTMVLAAANAYLGLFAGVTIATAIPAAGGPQPPAPQKPAP